MNARLTVASLLALGTTVVLGACGLATKGSEQPLAPGCTQGCSSDDGGVTDTKDGGFAVDAAPEGGDFNPYCGTGCNPDELTAVSSCEGAPGSGTQSQSGKLHPDPGLDAGTLGCQVVRTPNGTSAASCIPYGTGAEAQPCESSSDCSPGMACITEMDEATTSAGRCRQYCCGGRAECTAGRYCIELRLFEPTLATDARLLLPVCAPATNCKLLEPGQCGAEQVCTLVNEKTTTCDTPGKGEDGDKCPCAEGYFCGKTGSCKKLCHVGADALDCGAGICESGGAFPDGFGICTGP